MRLRATYAVVLAAFVLMLSCATATCDVRCSLAALSGRCHTGNSASPSMTMPAHTEGSRCPSRNTSPGTPFITTHAATLCLHHAAPALLDDQDTQSQRLAVDLSAAPPTSAALPLPPPEIFPAHAVPLARPAQSPFASSAVLRV